MNKPFQLLAISAAAAMLAACGGSHNNDTPAPVATTPPVATASTTAFMPAVADTAAYIDGGLRITFDAPPRIGYTGTIKVFKADGTLADTIDVSNALVLANAETQTAIPFTNTESYQIGKGVANLTQWRFVYYTPITIKGNVASIKLHDGALAYGTDYYVTMDPGVLAGTVGGAELHAITGAKTWTFHTKAAPTATTSVTVDDDGVADFRSVQGALNWMMANGCVTCQYATDAKSITIKNGDYNELLFLRNVNNLTLTGESRAGVVVHAENYESYNPGTGGSKTAIGTTPTAELGLTRMALGGGRAVFLVENADLLKLSNFTLQNTHVKQTIFNNQAEAIYYNSSTLDGSRFIATFMNFISAQDTVQTKGWAWYYQSYIAGDVDFIWGSPYAAMFEQSELHTVFDPTGAVSGTYSGGYQFQARAAFGYPGFVVANSSLTADANVPAGSAYLGRSGGLTVAAGNCNTKLTTGSLATANIGCDNVAYIGNKIGPHIAAVGWFTQPASSPIPDPLPSVSAGWRESGSLNADGTVANVTGRSGFAATNLDLSGVSTRAQVFSAWKSGTGWAPTP